MGKFKKILSKTASPKSNVTGIRKRVKKRRGHRKIFASRSLGNEALETSLEGSLKNPQPCCSKDISRSKSSSKVLRLSKNKMKFLQVSP